MQVRHLTTNRKLPIALTASYCQYAPTCDQQLASKKGHVLRMRIGNQR